MSLLTIREQGKKVLATGAEAFARGALEAGIGFFAMYPGTPVSGVGDSLAAVHNELEGLYFEYSMNDSIYDVPCPVVRLAETLDSDTLAS